MSYADALRNECSTLKARPGSIAIIGHVARVLRTRARKPQLYNLRVSPDVRGTGTIVVDIRRFRRSGFGPAPGLRDLRPSVAARCSHGLPVRQGAAGGGTLRSTLMTYRELIGKNGILQLWLRRMAHAPGSQY